MRDMPIYLAHDHTDRLEDLKRDHAAGVTGKILHMLVDAWIDAPTPEQYEASYFGYDGFVERAIEAVAKQLRHERENPEWLKIVRTIADLHDARAQGQFGLILGTEGGKLIGDSLSRLDAFYELGMRHIQFNWSMRNKISASQENELESDRPGLTSFGRSVVSRMNELGMVVDVSHSSPTAIADTLAETSRPILNSHSGSRDLAPKLQNLWDDQIRAMAANGGVIGIHFCSRLVLGVNDRQAEIADVVRQIRYVADVGGINVIALGPDFILGNPERDSLYIRNTSQGDISWTRGLESTAEIENIIGPLESDGFSEPEIEKILGGNLFGLFTEVLPA